MSTAAATATTHASPTSGFWPLMAYTSATGMTGRVSSSGSSR